jgi:hypothetical protein
MPKLISHKLIFLNSKDRSIGTIPSSTFYLPKSLTDIDNNNEAIATRAIHAKTGNPHLIYMGLTLNDFVLPRTFFNTESFNNKFGVWIETTDSGGGAWHIISVPFGSYNSYSAKAKLQTILNDSTNGAYWSPTMTQRVEWAISYDLDTSYYTFIATPKIPPATLIDLKFDFSATSGVLVKGQKTCFDLMGFFKNTTNTLAGGGTSMSITSTRPATTQTLPALYIRSKDLMNENMISENGGYTKSDILGRIFLTAPPYSNLIYLNIDSDYQLKFRGRFISQLNIRITDEEDNELELVDDWSMSIQWQIWEEFGHEEVEMLEKIFENQKTMLLQNEIKKS